MTPPAVAPTRPRPSGSAPRRPAMRRPAARGTSAKARPAGFPRQPRAGAARGAVTPPAGARASAGAIAPAPPVGLRLAHALAALPHSRLVDRMVRGRIWIAVLAIGLVGIVFLQISLLKLNTGISRSVETQQTLERQNATLKSDLSRLGGGERVRESAAVRGFVSPATGQPRFVDARRSSAERAAENVTAPAPIQQLPIGMIGPQDGGTGAAMPDPVSVEVAAAPAPAPAAAPAVGSPAHAASATGGHAATGQG